MKVYTRQRDGLYFIHLKMTEIRKMPDISMTAGIPEQQQAAADLWRRQHGDTGEKKNPGDR
ncbi:MAG: hypothetical protein SOH80_06185 [Eubacteriales bacterium]|jgi:hypothetical protein